MDKIVKYTIPDLARTTTRRQWKAISRWLRECENHTIEILRNEIPRMISCKVPVPNRPAYMEAKESSPIDKAFFAGRKAIVDFFTKN